MTDKLTELFDGKTVITFDVYGTLIDWETGIFDAMAPVLATHGVDLAQDAALELFAKHETALLAGPYLTYREVLFESLHRIGQELGFEATGNEREAFSHSVGDWPEFPDSKPALELLRQRFRLAVITNCDDELFALSNKRLDVEFDHVITAQQARSYKPSLNNFYVAFGRIEAPRHEILHVAESLFHDHVPAQALGLQSVWINRRQGKVGFGATPKADATPDAEFSNMTTFAAASRLRDA